LFRALQGVGGGGLQPMAQAILADTFPPEQRGLAFALYGITAVMAPTIGPTLGGWITFNYTWRWIFFINVPVGIMAWLLVRRFVEDPPYLARLKTAGVKLDYVGIGFLVLGIGALQIMLDRGQEDDWFGSRFITTFAVIAAVALISLVVWEWFQKSPIIDVRMFKNFNFASSQLMMFTLGISFFASLVLMPQFLQTQLGYTAELSGLALSAGGLAALLEMPIVGQLTTKVQARWLIAFGWLAMAVAMFYSTQRTDLQISFSSAAWLRIVQVIPLAFLFVPITMVAYIGIAPEKNNAVAGMVNFMRNMGSSVGTSMVTTLLARRSQLHQLRLVEKTRIDNQNFINITRDLTQRFAHGGIGSHDASATAYAQIYQSVQAQAATLSYIDIYMVLCVGAAVMFCISFFLKKNDPGSGGAVVE
jgi:DHA2 family multidrug resistance protein